MNQDSAFTTKYSKRKNVLMNDVFVHLPVLEYSELDKITKKNIRQYKAIWDTGATHSVVTEKLIKEINSKPISKTVVSGVGGNHHQDVHFVSVFLPNDIVFPTLRVTEAPDLADADVLIGMDIIGQGDFAVTNNGKTVFSFSIPSKRELDFVKENKKI